MGQEIPGKHRMAMLGALLRRMFDKPWFRAEPEIDGLHLHGLLGRLEYIRDGNGVSHFYAEHEVDLYMGVGYLQGKERFVLLDLLRHFGQGRLCELLTDKMLPDSIQAIGGAQLFEIDVFCRALGFAREAERDFRKLSLRGQKILEAFAEGINSSLRTTGGRYPAEYLILGKIKPWRAQDCLLITRACGCISGLLSLDTELTFNQIRAAYGDELAKALYPDAPWQHAPANEGVESASPFPALPVEPPLMGSNAWAVSGRLSASGKPILCNDPHVPLIPLPGYWHHVHLCCPKYNVQGGMFPGFPGFGFGHNQQLAWGVTASFRDSWDLVSIRRLERDPTRYHTASGVAPIDQHSELIQRRFGKDKLAHWESCEHGVMLPKWSLPDGRSLALRYIDVNLAAFAEGHLALMSATQIKQAEAALAAINDGPFEFNLVLAHQQGHVAWHHVGRLPKRKRDGLFVRDAADESAKWDGYWSFDESPKLKSPRSGLIVSANSITREEHHERQGTRIHFEPQYRLERITRLLKSRKKHTWQSMASIQQDICAEYALTVRDGICRALEKYPNTTGTLADAYQLLESWDGQTDIDNPAVSVFELTRLYLVQLIADSLFDNPDDARRYVNSVKAIPRIDKLCQNQQDPLAHYLTQKTGNAPDFFIQRAFERAVGRLCTDFGAYAEDWRWGNIQYVKLGSLLGECPGGQSYIALNKSRGGELHTINAVVSVDEGVRWRSIIGASSRFVCDLGNPKEAWFSHCGDAGYDESHARFRSRAEDWLAGRYFKSGLWAPEEVPVISQRIILGAGLDI